MAAAEKEKRILRDLAKRVAEIAALPVQAQRIRLWNDFNSLHPRRPMVLAFPEGGWTDLLTEADCRCRDPLLRRWEVGLRRVIYHHEEIDDDRPLTDFFNVPWVIRKGDYGLSETRIGGEGRGSYTWDAPVKTPDDFEKLHFPEVTIDRERTRRDFELAGEILGDILRVRIHGGVWWTCGLTMTLIFLRGLQQAMLDMYENPAFLHRLMAFLRDSMLRELTMYEAEGVLSLNNGPDDYIGSGGVGCTGELPADDFKGRVRLKDLWALGESQEFALVGPEQFYEFALRYQLPILERFGLVCYGCCESMEKKVDLVIRHVPTLRRVSVSPWCDRAVAAEKLTDRYIYSWKPNPTLICAPRVDWGAVEKVTRETIEIARGCCLEIIMKDTHTFQGDPTRPGRWTRIASRLAEEAA